MGPGEWPVVVGRVPLEHTSGFCASVRASQGAVNRIRDRNGCPPRPVQGAFSRLRHGGPTFTRSDEFSGRRSGGCSAAQCSSLGGGGCFGAIAAQSSPNPPRRKRPTALRGRIAYATDRTGHYRRSDAGAGHSVVPARVEAASSWSGTVADQFAPGEAAMALACARCQRMPISSNSTTSGAATSAALMRSPAA